MVFLHSPTTPPKAKEKDKGWAGFGTTPSLLMLKVQGDSQVESE